jgi:signal transduction histidine kinase
MSEPRRGHELNQLLDTFLAVAAGLDLPAVLDRIVTTAVELVDARYGALGILDPSGTRVDEFVAVGVDDDTRAAIGRLPEGHGILGTLISDARPLRLPDLGQHPDSYGFPPHHPEMRSFLGVPISIRGAPYGNLYLTDKAGGALFTQQDEDLVVALASVAAVAVDNARLHQRVTDLAVLEDRERIARELHDTVIQRLFAIGLSLQASLPMVEDAGAAARLETVVDDLDETVRQVRAVIFDLAEPSAGRNGEGPG